MISIQPIQLPFFGVVDKVKVYGPKLILGGEGASICVDLLINDGTIWKTIEQPLPTDIYQSWGVNDNIVIDWVLSANNINRL